MDDESRNNSAIQLRKSFDLQLSQSSTMVTSQHRENPLHNNHGTGTLHFRESALHVAKHLSKGIKRASCCLSRQSCHSTYKSLSLGKGDFIFFAKRCICSSNWSPPSVPAESTQHTPKTGVVLSTGSSTMGFWPMLGISWCDRHTNKPQSFVL